MVAFWEPLGQLCDTNHVATVAATVAATVSILMKGINDTTLGIPGIKLHPMVTDYRIYGFNGETGRKILSVENIATVSATGLCGVEK